MSEFEKWWDTKEKELDNCNECSCCHAAEEAWKGALLWLLLDEQISETSGLINIESITDELDELSKLAE